MTDTAAGKTTSEGSIPLGEPVSGKRGESVLLMRALKIVALGFALAGPAQAPAHAVTQREVQWLVAQEAMNSRVPPSLALAVARVESNFVPTALSPAGARGVMQIMPRTARTVFGVQQDDLWSARLNIRLGIQFLEQLYDQYGQRWDLALSHYNGGTLAGGNGAPWIPHGYTKKYVSDVMRWERHFAKPNAAPVVPRRQTVAYRADAEARARIDSVEARRAALRDAVRPYAAVRTPQGMRVDPKAAERVRGILNGKAPKQPEPKVARKAAPSTVVWPEWSEIEERRRDVRGGLDDFARGDG